MKINPIFAVIIAAALLLTVFGTGSFLAEAKDNIYDYNGGIAASSLEAGAPIVYSVTLAEKDGILTNCDKNGMGNRISPDTEHYCQSYTYFNARSIRVNIDGKSVANFYYYPADGTYADAGIGISTPLPSVGAVCCFNVPGACGVCADQNSAGTQFHRAFLFGKRVAAQTSISGSNLFTLTIPQNLAAGSHNVEIAYFAETYKGAPGGGNTGIPEQGIVLNGWTYGDQNQRINHVDTFEVNVVGGTTPPDDDGTVAPPPVAPPGDLPGFNTSLVTLAGIGIAAYIIYRIYLKRK
jgi:hypothetical protein